ncbi:MAG: NAD(+) diphosphatase [Pseudomonadota bacterium]|nr:NAD(+) diphosphatase [Pseudomonadota bacterium]
MLKPNFFAENGLKRLSEKRGDKNWKNDLLISENAVFLPFWRTKSLVEVSASANYEISLLSYGEISQFNRKDNEFIFLGCRNDTSYFLADLSDIEDPGQYNSLSGNRSFKDLREVGLSLSREEGGILAYSRALAQWHKTHKFCGRCGGKTESRSAGHVRRCSNPNCGSEHFPRTDPAVIMLVSYGEKVCLARKSDWPKDRFSVLAGFVEPGETPEGAVIREVKEEVGLAVTNVRYHSAQPWPFPANLMLGYFAEAESDEISIDDIEIEEAKWVTREDLKPEALAYFENPTSVSIARRLIADWVTKKF